MSRTTRSERRRTMPPRGGPSVRLRVLVVLVLFGAATSGLALRAVDLQVVRTGFLQAQGKARHVRTLTMPVSRGTIFDRRGVPLAVSTPVTSLWANPTELLRAPPPRAPEAAAADADADADADAERPCEGRECIAPLAAALGMDAGALEARLERRRGREFVYLKRRLSPASARRVLDLHLAGVGGEREYKRFYPSGEAMAHVIGFTDIDDHGIEGLERAYDHWLTGQDGSKKVLRDLRGNIIDDVALVREPRPGKDLYLSIDQRLQYLAYRELKAAVAEHGARAGSIVLMDVRNGEILALVNQPSFNPNALGLSNAAARRNRAITDLIEPGSVIKPFTIAAARESGRWSAHTPVDTSPGWLRLAGYTIHDVHNHGLLDVTGVLTKSSNVGAAEIAETLDARDMRALLARFGFGATSGSGFPGEAAGVLPPADAWTPLRKATISYGYGLSSTPLQLARAYAAIGNGGWLHVPSFVRGQHDRGEAILDPALARELLGMLETVVGPGGTAGRAAIDNYRVAGKTGTSHIAAGGGYSDRYVSTFVGLAPASDPRLVAVVVVDDPSGVRYYGGLVAAPLFRRVMGEALRLLDVPPDDLQLLQADAPAPPGRGAGRGRAP